MRGERMRWQLKVKTRVGVSKGSEKGKERKGAHWLRPASMVRGMSGKDVGEYRSLTAQATMQ